MYPAGANPCWRRCGRPRSFRRMPTASHAQALLGLVVFTALALPFSRDRARIDWRLVGLALLLQLALCFVLLRVPAIASAFALLARGVDALAAAARGGTSFLFGYLGGGDPPFAVTDPGRLVTFAFQVLPIVIVMSALSAVLWHWRVLPVVVRLIARLFERTLGVRGPAGLVATANIFVGQVEAPLLVRPYLAGMTRGELLLLMTAGLSTIAGSVMVIYAALLGPLVDGALGHLITKSIIAVPGAILFTHLLLPEAPPERADAEPPTLYTGTMDAVAQGTSDGLGIYLGILAMLLVLITLVGLVNGAVGLLPDVAGAPLTLERLAGWAFAPLAWLMGVPWSEAVPVGALLGIKTILNEFLAFVRLAELDPAALSERTRLITTYALCGFANLGSVGVLIGGIGTMCPARKRDVAELAPLALYAGTLGTFLSGAVVALVS
jgi:concentrative nucleoside transporter, CNT family